MHRSYGEERQEKIIGQRPKHDVKLLIFFLAELNKAVDYILQLL